MEQDAPKPTHTFKASTLMNVLPFQNENQK